jgi:hypothetical protein
VTLQHGTVLDQGAAAALLSSSSTAGTTAALAEMYVQFCKITADTCALQAQVRFLVCARVYFDAKFPLALQGLHDAERYRNAWCVNPVDIIDHHQ